MTARGTKKGGARKAKGPPPRPVPGLPGATRFGLLLARLWCGAFFLATAEYKLNQPGLSLGETIDRFRFEEYVPTLERAIASPPAVFGTPLGFYADFLREVMLPAASFAAPAILFFEALLGLCLVLGLGVLLMAALGVVLMLGFNLAKVVGGWEVGDPVGVYLLTVRTANWPVTLLLLLLALAAAGRILGLDRGVPARAPRGLRWIA